MRADRFQIDQSAVFAGVTGLLLLFAAGIAETKEGHRAPPCDVDCVSREAGYAWGKELGIEDPTECGGSSNDFIAGCQAYATKHEDPMARPADDQASDDAQDKSDDIIVDDKVDVLTGPSADPDANLPLPSEAPDTD